jgi:hypothetical protein
MTASDRGPVEILRQYWYHLENDEFEAATMQFSQDVTYLHPPAIEGVTEVSGRDDLLEFFRDTRGPRDIKHTVERKVVDGNEAGIVGVATGEDVDGVHVYACYLETEDDEITYYSTCNRDLVI